MQLDLNPCNMNIKGKNNKNTISTRSPEMMLGEKWMQN